MAEFPLGVFMKQISFTHLLGLCLFLLAGWTGSSRGEIFDTDSITSGRIPAEVTIKPDNPKALVVRAIREYVPCLRIQVVEPMEWEIGFGDQKAESGQSYSFAVTLASFGKPGRKS
jgi:hypothetical protein